MGKPDKDDSRYAIKRLTMNVPKFLFDEVQLEAKQSGLPMNILLRQAFELFKVCRYERSLRHKILVADEDQNILKEIVVP